MKLDSGIAKLTIKEIVELLLKDQSNFGQLEVTSDDTGEEMLVVSVAILAKAKQLKEATQDLFKNTQEVVSGTILEDGTVQENE